jgi:predicted dehydrogenase
MYIKPHIRQEEIIYRRSKTMKIGIIGAENTHTAAIAKTINVDKLVKGSTVDYVWGETKEFAENAAKQEQIPNIVSKPQEMLGKIDALVVDHRHPKFHLKAAIPFIQAKIPTFIDKPFCYRIDEGKAFLALAKKCGTPITSFGALPEQSMYEKFVKSLKDPQEIISGATYGPCDIKSPYGGVFFYGIHQVEMALNAFGFDVSSVLLTQNRLFLTKICF